MLINTAQVLGDDVFDNLRVSTVDYKGVCVSTKRIEAENNYKEDNGELNEFQNCKDSNQNLCN